MSEHTTHDRTPPVAGTPSVLTRLETLSDDELNALVEAAVAVLEESAPADAPAGVADLPRGRLTTEVRSALTESGVSVDDDTASRIVRDRTLDRQLAIVMLRELGKDPRIAREIERTYEARGSMMAVDGGLVLAAALLVLAMKIRKVKTGKDGVEIDFSDFRKGMLTEIKSLLGA